MAWSFSLLGSQQIIKTFAIPKLMYRASVLPISKDLIKEADSLFYYFIWNGKDKVKRNVMISEVEKGGLDMLNIDSMACTRRVICIKKYLEDYKSPWKAFLNEILIPVVGRLILHCNFDTSKLSIYLPSFYKQCFDAWSEVNAKTPSLLHEITNEVILNNKIFCQTEVESVEHLLFSCRVSSSFWKHVLSSLRDYNISVDNLKEEDVIFGKLDIAEDFLLFKHILLRGKFYIYSRKYQNSIPSLQGSIARTRRIYNIELHIARKRDKLNNHFRKWEKLISVFTNK